MNRAAPLPLRKKLVFAATASVIGLLLIEAACRLVLAFTSTEATQFQVPAASVETDWLGILSDDVEVTNSDVDLYVEDPELFWGLRPSTQAEVANAVYQTHDDPLTWSLSVNADGNRAAPYPEHDASPLIVCLGDSCTFGFRVSDDETYPAQLNAYLRGAGWPAAKVVNYGVPGYSSYQGKILLERILSEHRPDFVVLAFGANDLEQDRLSDAEKASRLRIPRITTPRAFERLAVVRLLRGSPSDRRTADPATASKTRVSPAEYRQNLSEMVRLAKQHGSQVVLLDLVFISTVFRETIAGVADEYGLTWVDGRETLRAGLRDLQSGDRYRQKKEALDEFWSERVAGYRTVYYEEEFYQQLFADEVWSQLLKYFMVEPVHANKLGNQVIAERLGDTIGRMLSSLPIRELPERSLP